MRQVIFIVFALFVSGVIQQADAKATWRHFGANPAYTTRGTAIKDATRVMRSANYPEQVIRALVKAMKLPGKEVCVSNGTKLNFMRSGKNALWRDVLVAFDTPPVNAKMAYCAPSEEWSVPLGGTLWVIGIPKVCHNLYGIKKKIVPVKPIIEACYTVRFDSPVRGFVRWGVGTTQGPLSPSGCNAQRHDNGVWTAWIGECDVCTGAKRFISKILGGPAEIPHKYLFKAKGIQQELRFSSAITKDVLYICLQLEDGTRTCGVYVSPSDWKGGKTLVVIPNVAWQRDNGNCPR